MDHTGPVSAPYIGLTCLRARSSTEGAATLVNLKHLSIQAGFIRTEPSPEDGPHHRKARLKLNPKNFFQA